MPVLVAIMLNVGSGTYAALFLLADMERGLSQALKGYSFISSGT
jgi:hypothetical protein